MKLFGDFEAVRFVEENLIFVTNREYLYYIYNPKYKRWNKHKNAGNDSITVKNYQDVTIEEVSEALNGVTPCKETDFMRKCDPSQLCIRDMFDLFREDYPNIISDGGIHQATHRFLLESDICFKSYLELRKIFDGAIKQNIDNQSVLNQVLKLSLDIIGRDIFKEEIGIVDGHDSSSYFWIMPVRVVDYSDTNAIDSVAEMRSIEISIEEDDVSQYLTPFLDKYFDNELEANKKRVENSWKDEDGNEQFDYVSGFEWYLTHNFYSIDAVEKIVSDIKDTIDALLAGRENEYTKSLRVKRGFATHELLYARNLTEEQIREYNDNRPKENHTEVNLIVDFYQRFIYRMEYMMKVGVEKGYDLISFMGP